MALHWDFEKDRIGSMWKRDGKGKLIETHLYDGNATMVECYEWINRETGVEQYQVQSFFAHREHAKACLGLSNKDHTTIYDHCKDLSVELWGTKKSTIELATLFMKAGITVEYRKERNI